MMQTNTQTKENLTDVDVMPERPRLTLVKVEMAGDAIIQERETPYSHSLWCWGCLICESELEDEI